MPTFAQHHSRARAAELLTNAERYRLARPLVLARRARRRGELAARLTAAVAPIVALVEPKPAAQPVCCA